MRKCVIDVRVLRRESMPDDRASGDRARLWSETSLTSEAQTIETPEVRTMSNEQAVLTIVTGAGRDRFVTAVFAVVLISAALYFGRVVLEPVAFVLVPFAVDVEIGLRQSPAG
jgi:hypothetical protein